MTNIKILGRGEQGSYGGKINNLDFLFKKGCSVPKGFILEKPMEEDDLNTVYQSYIDSNIYIVRSSATCEDSKELSYAGLFRSKHGLYSKGKLYEDIIEVFESVNSEYIELYEQSILGYIAHNRKMNILVQEYIPGDYSGVYFSRFNNQRVLNFVRGGNSLLVEGQVNGTNVYMGNDYQILKQEYNNQEFLLNNDLEILAYNNKVHMGNDLFREIIKTFIKVEKLYNYPIDIEWTTRDSIVYILQVRPVTQ